MKIFYKSSYYFWIATKIIFAIGILVAAFPMFFIKNPTLAAKTGSSITLIYGILQATDLIVSLSGGRSKLLKYFTGGLSVILGLSLIYLAIKAKPVSILFTLLLSVWLFLLGLFDLLRIEKKTPINSPN
jgi:hypothetical protein